MKQTLSVGMTAATFLMTVALAAQAPPPQQPNPTPQQPTAEPRQQPPSQPQQQPPSQPQQRSESAAAGKITVSGCIAKAEQPGAQGFELTNAKAGAASSTSGGAVGTTGAAPSASASAATTYRLDADSEKLTPHVGHRVEIVGTSAPMADSSAARSAEPGRPAPPSLKVESIKMVSQSCQ